MKKINCITLKVFDETLSQNHRYYETRRTMTFPYQSYNGIIYDVYHDGSYVDSFRMGSGLYMLSTVVAYGVDGQLDESIERLLGITYDREANVYKAEDVMEQYNAYVEVIKAYADIKQYERLKEKYLSICDL